MQPRLQFEETKREVNSQISRLSSLKLLRWWSEDEVGIVRDVREEEEFLESSK
jgi:hypothetical protein